MNIATSVDQILNPLTLNLGSEFTLRNYKLLQSCTYRYAAAGSGIDGLDSFKA